MSIKQLSIKSSSLVGVDVKRLHRRANGDSSENLLQSCEKKQLDLKQNWSKIKRLSSKSKIRSIHALEKTSHCLGLCGSHVKLGDKNYPSKPEVRKRHWFAAGVLICFSSWISINSTASIKQTDLNSVGLDTPPVIPSSLNLIGESSQAISSVAEQIATPQINEIDSKKTPTSNGISKNIESNLNNFTIINHVVKRGETLGGIFEKLALPRILPTQIVATPEGKRLKNISIGKTLSFELENGEFRSLNYRLSPLKQISIAKNTNGAIDAKQTAVDYETRTSIAEGTIKSSLFLAASEAGISDNLIMELASIFGWDIDFVRDIRTGDKFKLVFEQHHKDGNILSEGSILAAEFTNKGETFSAVRFEDSNGDIGYYSEDGKNMKGTFLKSPMKFSRVSSGFSRKRFHPVLKRWRAHKGVDYAAGSGTPIRSTANGKIIFKGTKGGYGRTVIISHGGKYSTLYAHMKGYGKGIRSGGYVKQGQTIGYVGASGLATGPHLHYEFRVNGVHRNPLTFKTPKSTPVAKKDIPQFEFVAKKQLALLNNGQDSNTEIQIASINTDIPPPEKTEDKESAALD